VGNIHANFQASSSIGMGGGGGDKLIGMGCHAIFPQTPHKIITPPLLRSVGIIILCITDSSGKNVLSTPL